MTVIIQGRTLVAPPLNVHDSPAEDIEADETPSAEQIGLRFGGIARASLHEEMRARAAHLAREENRIALAKDAVLKKAERLRSREEALEIRERELEMRRKLFDRRVAELLRREIALAASVRPLLQ